MALVTVILTEIPWLLRLCNTASEVAVLAVFVFNSFRSVVSLLILLLVVPMAALMAATNAVLLAASAAIN